MNADARGDMNSPDDFCPVLVANSNDPSTRTSRDRRYHLSDRRKVINAWRFVIDIERRQGVRRRTTADRRQVAA